MHSDLNRNNILSKLVLAATHLSLFTLCATPEINPGRRKKRILHHTKWPLAAWAASQTKYNLKRKGSTMPQGHCAELTCKVWQQNFSVSVITNTLHRKREVCKGGWKQKLSYFLTNIFIFRLFPLISY